MAAHLRTISFATAVLMITSSASVPGGIALAAPLQPIAIHLDVTSSPDLIEVRAAGRRGGAAVGPRGGAVVHRGGAAVGPRGGAYHGRTAVRGPRGNVAVRSTTAVRGGGWARPGHYRWPRGGAIAAGAAIGFVSAATAAAGQVRRPRRGCAGTTLIRPGPKVFGTTASDDEGPAFVRFQPPCRIA